MIRFTLNQHTKKLKLISSTNTSIYQISSGLKLVLNQEKTKLILFFCTRTAMNQYLSIIIVTIKESGYTKMNQISCFIFVLWL